MRRLFRVAFFACGWTGLLLNLVFILVSFNREAEVGLALETAMSQEREFSMQRQGDKISDFGTYSTAETALTKNQGRMSLTSRTYCECLFHTTTTESGWWARQGSNL